MNLEDSGARALLQAAEAFGLDVDHKRTTWKTNHVARVETRDGLAYAVKHFRSPALAARESSILVHLANADLACGIQTLHLCTNRDALATTDLGPMMASQWIEGASKPYRQIDAEGWRQLGRALASLHQALVSYRGETHESLSTSLQALAIESERTRIASDRQALQAIAAPSEALALQDAKLHLLESHLVPCMATWPTLTPQLLHNDYNVHNYLFDTGGALSVIDWDRCVLAPREYEVVRCLNHLPLESPGFAAAFLAGYTERAVLDRDLLKWAVHASMLSHASKHWPNELALAGAPGALERLVALEPMVSRLAHGEGMLLSFFQDSGSTKGSLPTSGSTKDSAPTKN